MTWRDDSGEFGTYGVDGDDADDVMACPECGAEVYALGDRCPRCGYWIMEGGGDDPLDVRRPYRNTKLVAGCLLLVIGLLLFFGLVLPLIR